MLWVYGVRRLYYLMCLFFGRLCFLVYIVNLGLADRYIFVLRNLRSSVGVFKGLCFYSTIFIVFVIAVYSSMLSLLIQLLLLFYFVLYPVWITYPPQDPIIRSPAARRTEGRYVSVLGQHLVPLPFWVATRGLT